MNRSQIKELVSNMTLEEKAGQMTQFPSTYYDVKENHLTGTDSSIGIPEDKKWLVGSILGKLGASSMINLQEEYLKRSRLKIPLMFMTDIIHGYKTIFPVPLALSCSWNPNMAEEIGRISAKEGSAAGYQVTFSPMVDLVRDPRWGRVMESFGEDKKINSDFGSAMVRGYQGKDLKKKDSLAACVKHFAGYGAVEGGRDYNSVDISEFTFYNQYLPSFQACIDAKVKLVMAAFHSLNGIPCTANSWLLSDVLRKEMDFEGIVISDWGAVNELICHGLADTEKMAGEKALESGIQIEMATAAILSNIEASLEKNPELEIILDDAVEKILLLKDELGLFEAPYRQVSREREQEELLSSYNRKAAREAVTESCVLLENHELLPLAEGSKMVLMGPYAKSRDIMGPWSLDGCMEDVISLYEGLQNKNVTITEVLETDFFVTTEEELKKAEKLAKETPLVILTMGEPQYYSGEAGCMSVISLPDAQISLLKKLKECQAKVVVILFNGRPLDLREVKEYADAILEVWYPGTEGGNGIADLIMGDRVPEAHLTMSFPCGSGQIPVYYNCGRTGRPKETLLEEPRYKSQYLDIPNEPCYPFGYGMSYTEFRIDAEFIMGGKVDDNGYYHLKVDVSNIGKTDGTEVVQVYARKKVSHVAIPVKELIAYQKVFTKKGTTVTLEILIFDNLFGYYQMKQGWTKENGEYIITIGNSSQGGKELLLVVE